MSQYPRAELEEMLERFKAANDLAGQTGDWQPLANLYAEDALYTWNLGTTHEFVARGRTQIRDWVMGTEMAGLEGWQYPYVRTLIDDVKGEVVVFWRQVAPQTRPDGTHWEIPGTGGSWFHYAGNFQWDWQRDWFDHMNAGQTFLAMMQAGQLTDAMQARLTSGVAPGWTPIEEFDWLPTIPGGAQTQPEF